MLNSIKIILSFIALFGLLLFLMHCFFFFFNLQVLILSEKLHSVTAQFDQLRAIRFQDAINKATPRRKLKHVPNSNAADTSKSNISKIRELDGPQPESLNVQQQLLDDETRALQVIRICNLIISHNHKADNVMVA